ALPWRRKRFQFFVIFLARQNKTEIVFEPNYKPPGTIRKLQSRLCSRNCLALLVDRSGQSAIGDGAISKFIVGPFSLFDYIVYVCLRLIFYTPEFKAIGQGKQDLKRNIGPHGVED